VTLSGYAESPKVADTVIDALDQCKIALQYVAERQSAGLTAVLDLLVERLDTAIGQAHAQLRQCQCHAAPRATSVPASRGALTVLAGCRQTPHPPALPCPEELLTRDERLCPDV
jgi:hypothetical protein